MEDTKLTITVVLDLLGFSQHLELGNNDIRTKIGNQAIERLSNLEKAISIIEAERNKHKDIFPSELFYIRINDSVILNIDLNDDFMPSIGNSSIEPGKFYMDTILTPSVDQNERSRLYKQSMNKKTLDVCLFIGLVARIHNYINQIESESNLPGCRTIISTGLRRVFLSNEGEDDRLSANFSFSNAYLVSESGSKGGFDGNNIYIRPVANLVYRELEV